MNYAKSLFFGISLLISNVAIQARVTDKVISNSSASSAQIEGKGSENSNKQAAAVAAPTSQPSMAEVEQMMSIMLPLQEHILNLAQKDLVEILFLNNDLVEQLVSGPTAGKEEKINSTADALIKEYITKNMTIIQKEVNKVADDLLVKMPKKDKDMFVSQAMGWFNEILAGLAKQYLSTRSQLITRLQQEKAKALSSKRTVPTAVSKK